MQASKCRTAMLRESPRTGLSLLGVALVLIATIAGWAAGPTKQEAKPQDFAPLFDDWPNDKPDLAFVLSGEMYGYLRPCGCSPGQHGGLARRGGLLRYLTEEKGWNTLPLDLGDLIGDSRLMLLQPLRYSFALESLTKLGYPVIGIGQKDLSLSINEWLGHALNAEPTKFVHGNLRHKEEDFQAILGEVIRKTILIERGGIKVAVSALTSDSDNQTLPDKTITVTASEQAVQGILAEMNARQPDFRVLLAHMSVDEAKALAARHPGFDLILCRSRLEDSATEEASMVGNTMVTWVGRKGKAVGIVGFWRNHNPRLRFELVPLDLRFPNVDEMNEVYARLVMAIKNDKLLEKYPRVDVPGGNEYVGARKCKECHEEIYKHWTETGHFHAMETLRDIATPAGQDYNPECVRCHVVALDYRTGFQTIDSTPELGGVQCENCHGPGKKHIDDPENPDLLTPAPEDDEAIERSCIVCHDVDNSLNFDFSTYWPKVRHPEK